MKSFLALMLLAGAFVFTEVSAGATSVTVTLDPGNAGPAIPDDFTGLSYEMPMVRSGRNGNYYFTPTNQPLIQLFKTLGIKSLRVGGNTADRDSVAIPSTVDADSLFAFAKAAGAKVIYTLRLKGGDPQADAAMAKYLTQHYSSGLECFTLGNEPNKAFTNFNDYHAEMERFLAAIAAPGAAPDARFCGPSVVHMQPQWTVDMAYAFAGDRRMDFLTQHYYCAKSGLRATNAVAARDTILSPDLLASYEMFYNAFMPAVVSKGLTCRIEETSSFSNAGAPGASDTFASALWAVDYLHWWAVRGGMRGFNFHMGRIYGAFVVAPGGYSVRPLSYGIKAFDLGGHGRIVPVKLSDNPDNQNLTAYGVRDATNLYVTLINKEHDAAARDAMVTVVPGATFTRCEGMLLQSPNGDVAAKSDLTLGGSSISGGGQWNGHWTSLAAAGKNGWFRMKVPAATVVILKFNLL